MLFDEGADDFLVELNRAKKTDGFTGQSIEPRAECQVVAFDTLREDFPGQMYLAWDFPGIAAPVITGDKTKLKRGKQAQQFTSCLIVAQAEGVGNHSFSFGIKGIPKSVTIIFVAYIYPLLIEVTNKHHIIQHNLFGGSLPFRGCKMVLMPILRTRAVSRRPEPLKAIW